MNWFVNNHIFLSSKVKILLLICIITIFIFTFIPLKIFANKDTAIDILQSEKYIITYDYNDMTIFDGDSFLINKQEIRLLYIDAPEYNQTCFDDQDREYKCGLQAKEFLINILANNIKSDNPLTCFYNFKDKYNRFLSLCQIIINNKLTIINSFLVKNGFALNYNFGEYQYLAEEEEAKKEKKGIWQYHFLSPAKYRKITKNNKKIKANNDK